MLKYALLAPKNLHFNGYFALLSHVFHASKGFCLYHFNVFLCLIALHLAPFCLAFSTKTPSILHQNALHLAPKRIAFSGKTHCILLQIAQKLVQMAL